MRLLSMNESGTTIPRTLRTVLLPLLFATAGAASAGVITMDGVVFTTSYTGNVLTPEIDAAGRSGGWAGASAIDALGLKTAGSFDSVKMTSSTGANWTLSGAELNASGCGGKDKGKAGNERICYSGGKVDLADNMLFTFTFEGSPTLGEPHLKVHFVNASGAKVGSLLSMDFPWQAETLPVAVPDPKPNAGTPAEPVSEPVPPAPVEPILISQPELGTPGGDSGESGSTPILPPADSTSGDVPEPASMAILGAGLAGIAVARRLKGRKA